MASPPGPAAPPFSTQGHPWLCDLHGHQFVRLVRVSADTNGDDISSDITSCPVTLVSSGDDRQEPFSDPEPEFNQVKSNSPMVGDCLGGAS